MAGAATAKKRMTLSEEEDADPEVAAGSFERPGRAVRRSYRFLLLMLGRLARCTACASGAFPTPPPGVSRNSLQVRLLLPPVRAATAEASCTLDGAGWQGRSSWHDVCTGVRSAHCDLPEPGERCQGWQHHGSRACSFHLRETELLAYLVTLCPGHTAFAVRAACSRVAQCHPERGWLRSAARPHAHSFAAAVDPSRSLPL